MNALSQRFGRPTARATLVTAGGIALAGLLLMLLPLIAEAATPTTRALAINVASHAPLIHFHAHTRSK